MQIDQSLFEFLFLMLMSISIAGILWIFPTWLLLSVFTPKTLLEKYFKEPHFKLAETIMMAQFPGFLMRTAMFGWALLLPNVGKKRGIKYVRRYIPFWYACLLNILTIGSMITLFLFFSLTGILFLIDIKLS